MARLKAFLALGDDDRRLLVEASLRLLAAGAALQLLPFRRVARTLGGQSDTARPVDPDLIRRIRWAVETAARHLPLSLTCLPQALAASWMLQARGFAPRMLYGVASLGADAFEAHAWVELADTPVIGHGVAQRFTVLTSFPEPTP